MYSTAKLPCCHHTNPITRNTYISPIPPPPQEHRGLRELLSTDASRLTFGLKFSLMCAVRFRRLLQSGRGARVLLRLQYQVGVRIT
jgi:hypothetical protein